MSRVLEVYSIQTAHNCFNWLSLTISILCGDQMSAAGVKYLCIAIVMTVPDRHYCVHTTAGSIYLLLPASLRITDGAVREVSEQRASSERMHRFESVHAALGQV